MSQNLSFKTLLMSQILTIPLCCFRKKNRILDFKAMICPSILPCKPAIPLIEPIFIKHFHFSVRGISVPFTELDMRIVSEIS